MNIKNVKIKLLREGARIPKYATDGSAGADLYALLPEPLTLVPGGRALVPTGISIELPDGGYAALIYARSGLASKHGITLANCVGVVDSDYRGEVCVSLVNLGNESFTVNTGERIAQMVITPVTRASFTECDGLTDTERGTGGFGSTGKTN